MVIILNEISTWHPQSGDHGVVLKNVVSDYSALVIQMSTLLRFRIQKPLFYPFCFNSIGDCLWILNGYIIKNKFQKV